LGADQTWCQQRDRRIADRRGRGPRQDDRTLPAAELSVDLREALSQGNGHPSAEQAAGDQPPTAEAPPPAEPSPATYTLSTELDPGDVYRIEEGREVRESFFAKLGESARALLTPRARRPGPHRPALAACGEHG
jgi:hypothetical protein